MRKETINSIISYLECSDAKSLGPTLDEINQIFFEINNWNAISVKAYYTPLVKSIEWNLQNAIFTRDCGTPFMEISFQENDKEVRVDIPIEQIITNLSLAKTFFANPPIVTKPLPATQGMIKKRASTQGIDWSKPFFTADEVKILLDMSDSTFRRYLDKGWLTYSKPEGSDKMYFKKEDILAFLNHPENLYPSSK